MFLLHFSIISFFFFVFLGCSFDYDKQISLLQGDNNVPTIEVTDLVYSDFAQGKEETFFSSENFKYFTSNRSYFAGKSKFIQSFSFNDDLVRGSFDSLEGSDITNDFHLYGNININFFSSKNEKEFYLLTGELFWFDENKSVVVPNNEDIFIRFDGNEFVGKGFSYLFDTNVFSFISSFSGKIVK